MICPKCGGLQPDGPACAQCGTVFFEGSIPATAGIGTDSGTEGIRSGPILSESFSIYLASFVPFLVISLVAFSPRILLGVAAPLVFGTSPAFQAFLPFAKLANLVAAFVGSQLAAAAVTYGVHQRIRGREATIRDSLRVGSSSLSRAVGVSILTGLGIGVGLLCLILPGILLALRWAVTVQVVVEERRGGTWALERSADLTAGSRREIFSVLFVVGSVSIVLQLVLTLGFALGGPTAATAGAIVAAVLTTGFAASASAVLYYRLRSAKESIDIQELASIFD